MKSAIDPSPEGLDRADIVEIEKQLANEQRLRAQAEEANRIKSEFLAAMSHEIRTPMNAVIGVLHLLSETRLTEEQQEYLTTLKQSGTHLLRIVDDVLDLSKIEAGKLDIEATEFELAMVVRDAIALGSHAAQSKNITLESVLDAGLPPILIGDPVRLKQVLANLISNAIKFTNAGRVAVQISPENASGDKVTVRFAVTDTGIGIPVQAQERLFQFFSQAESSTARLYGGSGLGLAISKRLVIAMGGSIGFDSKPDRGSTFWFTVSLPVSTGARSLSALAVSVSASAASAKRQSRVLVAEDNAINQRVAKILLSKLGYQADIAANGEEAVELLKQNTYDLVLMDCQMPVMDGFEATAIIRKLDGGKAIIPVIAVTANVLAGQREKCLAAGMNDYLPKPIGKDILQTMLHKWLNTEAVHQTSQSIQSIAV